MFEINTFSSLVLGLVIGSIISRFVIYPTDIKVGKAKRKENEERAMRKRMQIRKRNETVGGFIFHELEAFMEQYAHLGIGIEVCENMNEDIRFHFRGFVDRKNRNGFCFYVIVDFMERRPILIKSASTDYKSIRFGGDSNGSAAAIKQLKEDIALSASHLPRRLATV